MTWRQRAARWLDPTVAQWSVAPQEAPPPPPPAVEEPPAGPWPVICEQFAMRILASAYQMGAHLEAVEADEQDPERLERLYRIDHANTRIRRHAENLQVLLGRRVEDADSQTVTLVDVIRAATSAVEHYPRIRVGHVVDLAVVEFAADDVIRVLTELLDNATRFSPPTSTVIVSAYITEDGSVLLRVEDAGVGIHPDHLPTLNAMLAGQTPMPATVDPATHLGLAVVAHLAVAHRLRVTLTNRPSGGTTATVLVPGELVCETAPSAGLTPAGPAAPEPPAAWPPPQPPNGGGVHPWSTQMASARDSADSPTVRLATIAPQPTVEQQPADHARSAGPAGLPRRVPESVRADNPIAGAHQPGATGQHRTSPDDRSSPQVWPDETAAFAAGISDAQATTDEGQLR
ncbi:Histidine kinase-, DNA gyrase B-, and HSP90-like ATPase [Micromonospora rhizosphaerae]|uniref:histidine kinase n=1 Tax=Micromonospora rhizosphaerae TaxID=568872 RepID=A0A1C6SIT3_9ACTN|nr:ATP-binding protein [Micromonospora rhizosphaerae]SCL29307.1 Histidine kinase-, DNA gyrase B-, and HSP90-like ATPase [Micromonospora rhizosphaerae]